MQHRKRMAGVFLLVLAAALPGAAADAPKPAPRPSPTTAESVYLAGGCHQCHGIVGQGARGPTLAAVKYPYEAFRLFVRRPAGGGMPAYSEDVLSDAELRTIYQYVASLPSTPATLPALLQ